MSTTTTANNNSNGLKAIEQPASAVAAVSTVSAEVTAAAHAAVAKAREDAKLANKADITEMMVPCRLCGKEGKCTCTADDDVPDSKKRKVVPNDVSDSKKRKVVPIMTVEDLTLGDADDDKSIATLAAENKDKMTTAQAHLAKKQKELEEKLRKTKKTLPPSKTDGKSDKKVEVAKADKKKKKKADDKTDKKADDKTDKKKADGKSDKKVEAAKADKKKADGKKTKAMLEKENAMLRDRFVVINGGRHLTEMQNMEQKCEAKLNDMVIKCAAEVHKVMSTTFQGTVFGLRKAASDWQARFNEASSEVRMRDRFTANLEVKLARTDRKITELEVEVDRLNEVNTALKVNYKRWMNDEKKVQAKLEHRSKVYFSHLVAGRDTIARLQSSVEFWTEDCGKHVENFNHVRLQLAAAEQKITALEKFSEAVAKDRAEIQRESNVMVSENEAAKANAMAAEVAKKAAEEAKKTAEELAEAARQTAAYEMVKSREILGQQLKAASALVDQKNANVELVKVNAELAKEAELLRPKIAKLAADNMELKSAMKNLQEKFDKLEPTQLDKDSQTLVGLSDLVADEKKKLADLQEQTVHALVRKQTILLNSLPPTPTVSAVVAPPPRVAVDNGTSASVPVSSSLAASLVVAASAAAEAVAAVVGTQLAKTVVAEAVSAADAATQVTLSEVDAKAEANAAVAAMVEKDVETEAVAAAPVVAVVAVVDASGPAMADDGDADAEADDASVKKAAPKKKAAKRKRKIA